MHILHGVILPPTEEELKDKVQNKAQDEVATDKEQEEDVQLKDTETISEGDLEMSDSLFVCGICANGFDDQSACLEHMSSHLESQSYQCDECDCVFQTELEHEKHKEIISCAVSVILNH